MYGRRTLLAGIAGAGLFAATPAFAQSAFSMQPIQPQNPLESDFLAAFSSTAMRPVFRARLLESQVSLALAAGENPQPLQVTLQSGARAGVLFTSEARLHSVLGADAPFVNLTGREALTRLRSGNVAINYRLIPMLTLEADDVESLLRIPG